MGSVAYVKFLNIGKPSLNGFYAKYELNQDDKEVKFNVKPGQDLTINIKFNGFCYYSLSIHEDAGERRSNYFEIRSIADFKSSLPNQGSFCIRPIAFLCGPTRVSTSSI